MGAQKQIPICGKSKAKLKVFLPMLTPAAQACEVSSKWNESTLHVENPICGKSKTKDHVFSDVEERLWNAF